VTLVPVRDQNHNDCEGRNGEKTVKLRKGRETERNSKQLTEIEGNGEQTDI
jgi:hypothetical protein